MKPSSLTHVLRAANRFLLMTMLSISVSLTGFAGPGGGKLVFKDAKLESGVAGADGAIYRFSKVAANLDALVRIAGRSSSLVTLVDIDMKTFGFDKAWQPQVGYNKGKAKGAADWYMEFEMSFVETGTNTPAVIDQFDLTAIDIDGNGDKIREYISFYGLKSYILESTSKLTISKVTNLLNGILTAGTRFDGPNANYRNIDTSGTAVMVTSKYEKTQKFTLRLGAVTSGENGGAERMYSLYFQDFQYNQPTQAMLPVTLKSFDAKLFSSKVQLDWATAEEINFSHFIVERSVDGKEYKESALVFADAHSVDYKYSYAESVNQSASGLLYYRLKMVDRDGTYKFSAVRIVKMNMKNSVVAISAYPNPVANELRITIPSNWQAKQVVYDVVNMNGVIIKHKINASASQTETIQLGDLSSGIYVVRLKAGDESAIQQIVKK